MFGPLTEYPVPSALTQPDHTHREQVCPCLRPTQQQQGREAAVLPLPGPLAPITAAATARPQRREQQQRQ